MTQITLAAHEIIKIWELSEYSCAPRNWARNIKEQKLTELARLLQDIAERNNISKAALPTSLITAARKYDHWEVS